MTNDSQQMLGLYMYNLQVQSQVHKKVWLKLGLTQILRLSDKTLSDTCMPTNFTSSSAPGNYFGCISFPQKYYIKAFQG